MSFVLYFNSLFLLSFFYHRSSPFFLYSDEVFATYRINTLKITISAEDKEKLPWRGVMHTQFILEVLPSNMATDAMQLDSKDSHIVLRGTSAVAIASALNVAVRMNAAGSDAPVNPGRAPHHCRPSMGPLSPTA